MASTEKRRSDTNTTRVADSCIPIPSVGEAGLLTMFCERLDIKLIRLVKEYPVIYNQSNLKYMNFNEREVAWQKIGDELKRPGE